MLDRATGDIIINIIIIAIIIMLRELELYWQF